MTARLVSLVPTDKPGIYEMTIEVGGKLLAVNVRHTARRAVTSDGAQFVEMGADVWEDAVPVAGLEPEKP